MPRTRWLIHTTGAAVLAVSLTACSESGNDASPAPATAPEVALAEKPTFKASGKEVNHFEDIAKMTATSDLAIRGTVESAKPGRWVGPGGDDRLRVRDITIRVDEVLFSKDGSRPAQVTVDEWGWDAKGKGYTFESVTWTKAGDKGFYFLTHVKDAPGHERLVSSQGRVLVKSGKLIPSAGDDSALHDKIHGLSEKSLTVAVEQAERKFRNGSLKPQPRI